MGIGALVVGTGLVYTGAKGIYRTYTREKREMKELLVSAFSEAKLRTGNEQQGYELPQIKSLKKQDYGWLLTVNLPIGITSVKLKEKIKVIEEATASSIRIKPIRGSLVQLELGTIHLYERMDYDVSLVQEGKLTIPYNTPFGTQYLDFMDEAVCHLIVSGVTRMGKSVFLRLLFTQLMLATKGNIVFYYINNKIEDHYPMKDVPQIPEPAETIDDAHDMINAVLAEVQLRKEKLRSSKTVTNVKQWNKAYPDDPIPAMFVVFDEYGRFADDDDFQDKIVELSETAGYLDVHLVIATQRPDATTVLNPRIRANIITRVCFQTADEANSRIVVHTDDAYHLGAIRGRSIVLDGTHQLAHIPYISEELTSELLEPFRRVDIDESNEEGSDDIEVPETLPSFVTDTLGEDDLSECGETSCDSEPNHEAAVSGWFRLAGTTTEG